MQRCLRSTVLRTTNTCSIDEFCRPYRDSNYCESVYPALKRWAIFHFVTSRKRREIPRVDFGIDLLKCFPVLASWREILFKLVVPSELIAARDVRSQLRQLFRRQLIDGLFDFGEAHNRILAAERFIFNH